MNNKPKVVFIFGAGASVASGAPVMDKFLDKTQRLYRSNQYLRSNEDDLKDLEKVLGFIYKVQGNDTKSYIDLDNIENLFGLIETGLILENIEGKDGPKLQSIKKSLIALIVKTIEFSMKYSFEVMDLGIKYKGDKSYNDFFDTLRKHLKNLKYSFITFNYDLALDIGIEATLGKPILYINNSLNQQGIPLLKLHGSINWFEENGSLNARPLLTREYKESHPLDKFGPNDCYIAAGTKLLQEGKQPFLVPPSWNKTGYSQSISSVWEQTVKEIGEAEAIVVIGYSLPQTDMFFKYLYSLGSKTEHRLKRFVVYNPDSKLESQYSKILGLSIRENRFNYYTEKFQNINETHPSKKPEETLHELLEKLY